MPKFSKRAKGRALAALSRTKEKALRLEFTLRLEGEEEEADKVKARTRKLARQIDQLIREAMTEWLGNAATVEASLRTNNERLQRSIRQIHNSVQTANNIVKALGFIDDAISIAGRLVSPL